MKNADTHAVNKINLDIPESWMAIQKDAFVQANMTQGTLRGLAC